MHRGWVAAWRRLFEPDHPLAMRKEVCPRFAWLDLCQMASHQAITRTVGVEEIRLERGELLASFRFLAKRWGWSPERVRRFGLALNSRHMTETVRETPVGTVYRIVNYDTYANPQSVDRDTPRDTERDTFETAARQRQPLEPLEPLKEKKTAPQKNAAPVSAQVEVGFLQEYTEPPKRIPAWRIVKAWVEDQPTRPPDNVIKKQGAAAKRLSESSTPEQLAMAMVGIRHLFPHSEGEPWDLFTLEKKFGLAQAAAMNHPELKAKKRLREILEAIE